LRASVAEAGNYSATILNTKTVFGGKTDLTANPFLKKQTNFNREPREIREKRGNKFISKKTQGSQRRKPTNLLLPFAYFEGISRFEFFEKAD
jgi:hypothetical protein